MAKDFKKKDDKELINKIKHDKHMTSAVIECYETLRDILKELLIDEHEKRYANCSVILVNFFYLQHGSLLSICRNFQLARNALLLIFFC